MENTEQPPVSMAQLLDAMRGISERMTLLEQRAAAPAPAPVPPPAPAAANGPRNRARTHPGREEESSDSDMPSLEDDSDAAPAPNRQNRRNERERDRDRGRGRGGRDLDEDQPWLGGKDLKLKAPTFAGRVNPEAYIDWERRMEYIFEYYNYSNARKISLAAAQLTENALSWWDREVSERRRHQHGQVNTWEEMRYQMRKRYIPAYYHRELQKRFRKLTQGTKSVEEYFEEFETLKNRLETGDSEETLMAQFLDGLHDRITRKVERQTYRDLDELLHLAVQAEQHIKRKTASTTRPRPAWSSQPRNMDKGKSIETVSKFKKPTAEVSK